MNESSAWITYLSAIGDHYHRGLKRHAFFRGIAAYFTSNSCPGMDRHAQTLPELREWTGYRLVQAVQFALSLEHREPMYVDWGTRRAGNVANQPADTPVC